MRASPEGDRKLSEGSGGSMHPVTARGGEDYVLSHEKKRHSQEKGQEKEFSVMEVQKEMK